MVFHLKAKGKLLRLDSDGGLICEIMFTSGLFQQSDFRSGFPVSLPWGRKTHFRSGWTPGVFAIVSNTLEVVLRVIPLYLHAYPHDSHVFVPPPCHDVSHLALTGCGVYDEVARLHVVTDNWCCRPPLFEESHTSRTLMSYSTHFISKEPFFSLRYTYLALHHALVLCLWADVNFIREHHCIFKITTP